MTDPRCNCGAYPDTSETPGTGFYTERVAGRWVLFFICLTCWWNENTGRRPE